MLTGDKGNLMSCSFCPMKATWEEGVPEAPSTKKWVFGNSFLDTCSDASQASVAMDVVQLWGLEIEWVWLIIFVRDCTSCTCRTVWMLTRLVVIFLPSCVHWGMQLLHGHAALDINTSIHSTAASLPAVKLYLWLLGRGVASWHCKNMTFSSWPSWAFSAFWSLLIQCQSAAVLAAMTTEGCK